ncbi:Transcription factor [Penicillium griseofulvum]|uniref:Transcription factor n=1 Tax=Penicillium patulum TaxID=5078 RepID=A0A135LEL0_PENPA|nr:Transcription factor [Penicillium griseofulvum]KXG47407.1 Transcription factor [Penicillium griseofulvum]
MADTLHDYNGLASTAPRSVRKKFAKPPVKVACLPCRASRTRCGGQMPCANCVSKDRECSYLPSKRGGPRKKKEKSSLSPEHASRRDDTLYNTIPSPPEFEEAPGMFNQIDELSLPGAGLRHLDFQSDVPSMFQNFFTGDGSQSHMQVPLMSPPPNSTQPFVRTYGSEPEILNAYYDFIHNYFPILPPRASPPCRDRPLNCPVPCSTASEPMMMYRPRSPLSLALSAILALVPHPSDLEPSSAASVLQRRTYSHAFAQLANSTIEAECDLDLSSTDPGQALSAARPFVGRERFHSQAPVDNESLLALLVLSVYEYAQRGNLLKMRYRAGQALAIALDKSLHAEMGNDEFSEARRRAWWMTYYCVIQGSIVSTTMPAIVINDPQFTTPYPSFSSDAEGWSILIQAQQVLVSATQFIGDLNKCLSSQSGMYYMFERMQQLDSWTHSVIAQAELLPLLPQTSDFGDHNETITAQSIRAISRIKLSSAQIKTHRFRAFSDIPIFIKRHCDLTAANPTTTTAPVNTKPTGINNISCSCSNLNSFERASSTEYMTPSDSSTSSDIHTDIHPYAPQYAYPFASGFPYSTQQSAKICLQASLVISRMFHSLPVPQPLTDPGRPLPRTMPSFACCLMQSSYAMFMIYYKATVAKQLAPNTSEHEHGEDSTDHLIDELRQGLQRIIGAVSNYSLAFEALDGMRDEIEGAYKTAFPSASV